MKIIKTISIDLDIWLEFTKRTDWQNYSATIEALILAYNNNEPVKVGKETEQEIEIRKLQAKIGELQAQKAKQEKEKEKKQKERQAYIAPVDKWEEARRKLAEDRARRYDN